MAAPFSFLKSVSGPVAAITDPEGPITIPPQDGADLQSVYDDEMRYIRLMRNGRAPALWYDWVPALSLSVSGRESRILGDVSTFDNEPIATRSTGGTVVPQGQGTINISVFSHHPRHPGIRETYIALCQALMTGFATMGLETVVGARPGSFCDGDHNILLGGRKLVGTAQRWAIGADGSAICLHHCVILSGGDPDRLCSRAEALYHHAGIDMRYDRAAHSDISIDRATLRDAMDKPLRDYIVRSEEDRL